MDQWDMMQWDRVLLVGGDREEWADGHTHWPAQDT